tara:strand:+ start:21540 stop:21980 length:441 start_codon:yes stop_codon:yes gene_type:complete
MGGYTTVKLKDNSIENIAKQNLLLEDYGVPKKYRFYSELDIKVEYDAYKKGRGEFPEFQFPKDKINSYRTFKKYWKALGEVWSPPFGTIDFDCYYSRMSTNAFKNLGRYLANYVDGIESVSGSFSTFIEDGRGVLKRDRKILTKLI